MSVAERMGEIQLSFIEAKEFALNATQNRLLCDFLASKSGEFSSVSFEGASMGLAMNSYNKTKGLSGWNWYVEKYGAEHASQIYVGLGWAIAELDIDPKPLIDPLDPVNAWRVMDGYGYYHGVFRKRAAVLQQVVPEKVANSFKPAFDQGLGRSFWYNSRGQIERALEKIILFPKDRVFCFWRGLGVAIAYVGGIGNSSIETINHTASEENLSHLKFGVLMAYLSRKKAGSLSEETNRIVCSLVPEYEDVLEKVDSLKQKEAANYLDTITEIEGLL